MLYAILAYHPAGVVESWTPEQRGALMEKLHVVHRRHTASGKLGPAASLGSTSEAFTLRGPGEGVVIDGPFAETKEHLLGLYVIDCESRDEVIAMARELRRANPTAVYEFRPINLYLAGNDLAGGEI